MVALPKLPSSQRAPSLDQIPRKRAVYETRDQMGSWERYTMLMTKGRQHGQILVRQRFELSRSY